MKSYVKSSQISDWYSKDSYPEFADKLDDAYRINWNINMEDVECILSDDIDLSNVRSVRYLNEGDEEDILQEAGYEGGYLFTYNDGHEKMYAWKPYPRNIEELEEIEFEDI